MEINSLDSSPKVLLELTKSRGLEQLKPGSRLQATVVEKAGNGDLILRVGRQLLRFETPLPLKSDEKILIELVRQAPLPQFQLIRHSTPQEIQNRLMRQLLPKAGSLEGLLQRVAPLLGQNPASTPARQVQQALQSLLHPPEPPISTGTGATANQPAASSNELTPEQSVNLLKLLGALPSRRGDGTLPDAEQIRRAIAESGLFLEARLALGEPPMPRDIKLLLLKLLELLRQSGTKRQAGPQTQAARPQPGADTPLPRLSGELQQLVEGALARLQLQQFTALPQESGNRQSWQFGLPLPALDPVAQSSKLAHIRIEREPVTPEKPGAPPRWSLTLDMDIAPLGPIEVRIQLLEREISSHFMAQAEIGQRALEARLPQLQDALEALGLSVRGLSVARGVVSRERQPQATTSSRRLLDEKA